MLENWDRLKVFYHVFSQNSIIGAAGILNITQSAVSQTIRKLEKELGSPLFIRLHKKIIPSPAGDKLYRIVRNLNEELSDYQKDLKLTKDYPAGELRIGAPAEFGKIYLSVIAAQFRQEYPEVTFNLEFGDPELLLNALLKGKVDFVLLDDFLTHSPFIGSLEPFLFDPILKEKVILAGSKNYFLEHIKGDLSFSSLSGQNFISYRSDQRIIKTWFKKHFSKINVNVQAVLTVNSHEAVLSAIMNDVGLGILSSHLVRKELDSGRLIHIKTSENDIINMISLVQLLDKVPSMTEKIFIEFMTRRIQDLTSDYS